MKTFTAVLLASTVAFAAPAYAGPRDNVLGVILGQVLEGVADGVANQASLEPTQTYSTYHATLPADANGCHACANGAVRLGSEQYPAQYTLAHDAIASELLDPDSALFGGIIARLVSPGVAKVCTVVNAKNSFGGYVGDHWVIGTMTPGAFTIERMSTSANEDGMIYSECVRYGVIKASS